MELWKYLHVRGSVLVCAQILSELGWVSHASTIIFLSMHASDAQVRHHVGTHAVPSCCVSPSAVVSAAARLIKSTLRSYHRQEQSNSE